MLSRNRLCLVLLVVLLVGAPLLATVTAQGFYLDILSRIFILSIAVASLNLIVSGGMLSLGHAAYLGIGAYSVGILAFHEIYNGFLHLALGVGASALFALVTGAICLRTKGLYFILITLAFAQMLYLSLVSLEAYGGDDGLVIWQRSDFAPLLNLDNPTVMYYVALGLLALCLVFLHRLTRARFGRVIFAIRYNPERVQALGLSTYKYQLICYTISGAICGLAGVLLGNFTNFISPEMLDWSRSAELLFMLVVGGVGALFAPLYGTAAFILLEQWLSELTVYWHLPFGLLLIALVLRFGRGGMHALWQKWILRGPPKPPWQ